MVNAWGCNFVFTSGRHPTSFNGFDKHIRQTVPGFCLVKLTGSGTEANQKAIDSATGKDMSALLIGMGSYVGGDEDLQPYSTSQYSYNKQISLPKQPSDCFERCCNQTIALPYHAPVLSAAAAKTLKELEGKCLNALHRKLLVGSMTMKPYKALLLEYILGGNGGELSECFLIRLAKMLKAFNVVVIADEILTAGRVGPSILMTTTMPQAFLSCVEFITAGKVTDCGIVFKKVSRKPQQVEERLRGHSTQLEPSEAAKRWVHVQKRIDSGFITERRQRVLKEMSVLKKPDHEWGRGCLIFTSYARPSVQQGLKNRLLPMLEKTKIEKGPCKKTSWTRTKLNTILHDRALSWITAMNDSAGVASPFGCALIAYIGKSDKEKIVEFTDKEFLVDLGIKRSEELAASERKRIVEKNRSVLGRNTKCTRTPLTFVKALTNQAAADPPATPDGNRGFVKKRLGNKRIEKNIVDKDLLGYNILSNC